MTMSLFHFLLSPADDPWGLWVARTVLDARDFKVFSFRFSAHQSPSRFAVCCCICQILEAGWTWFKSSDLNQPAWMRQLISMSWLYHIVIWSYDPMEQYKSVYYYYCYYYYYYCPCYWTLHDAQCFSLPRCRFSLTVNSRCRSYVKISDKVLLSPPYQQWWFSVLYAFHESKCVAVIVN